ncbi:protein tweety homolog 1-like isoform X1 [Lampetra fluviatilis]
MAARPVPWWVTWLHGFPHLDFSLRPVDSTFAPDDPAYQQSLAFLAGIVGACLTFNLLVVAIYFLCRCCRRSLHRDGAELKRGRSRCAVWVVVCAALMCSAAIGVGFYGNSETDDGVERCLEGLQSTRETIDTATTLVGNTLTSLQDEVTPDLLSLEKAYAKRAEFLRLVRQARVHLGTLTSRLDALLPLWRDPSGQGGSTLSWLQEQLTIVEFYRWLAYVLLLSVDLFTCLLVLLGLAKQSRCLINLAVLMGLLMLLAHWSTLALQLAGSVGASDFCFAPRQFLANVTQALGTVERDTLSYYLECRPSSVSPFQTGLTGSVRAVSDLQSLALELLLFGAVEVPRTRKELGKVQAELNVTETAVHQLTALLDCRALNKDVLAGLTGMCWDGLKGQLLLSLFSLTGAIAMSCIVCAIPTACARFRKRERCREDNEDPFGPRASGAAYRHAGRMAFSSLYSYGSSFGSEGSLPALAHCPPSHGLGGATVPSTSASSNAAAANLANAGGGGSYTEEVGPFNNNPIYEEATFSRRQSPPPSLFLAASNGANGLLWQPNTRDGASTRRL